MKTRKTGGKYDCFRRAFKTVDDMAFYIDRSDAYCQARLTGGKDFTRRETNLLVAAMQFYDHTGIYPAYYWRALAEEPISGWPFNYEIFVLFFARHVFAGSDDMQTITIPAVKDMKRVVEVLHG